MLAAAVVLVAGVARPARADVEIRTGSITAWGYDYYGDVSGAPTGADFIAIAAGTHTGYALRADGSIAAWGWDNYGQVSDTPTGTGFTAIAGG
jgi:alpha-tubulin suppressor-like RCC1 family protein